MTIRRCLLRSLDRPGGRRFLARLATMWARRVRGEDVEILWDGVWIHRLRSGDFVVDSKKFRYFRDTIESWDAKFRRSREIIEDFWFHDYRPTAGDVVVDVGAGTGEDTFVFARAVGESGRVLAIEAHPETFRHLETNCRWNRLSQVECRQVALMNEPGTVEIDDGDRYLSNSVLGANPSGRRTLSVPAVALDDLIRQEQLERIDFLKMNIEGAERFALPGMRATLAKTAYVCICCHDHRADRGDGELFRTRELVTKALREQGFEVEGRDDDPRPYVRHHLHGINEALVGTTRGTARLGACTGEAKETRGRRR